MHPDMIDKKFYEVMLKSLDIKFGTLADHVIEALPDEEPFEHLADDVNGYYVSTNDTFDHGLETMIFKIDESGVIDWSGVYSERYDSAEKAIERHKYICSHIDEFVGEVS